MDAFRKYFIKSRAFGDLFYMNFGILSLILMLGFIRLALGLMRDKPVVLIAFILVSLSIIIILYLFRLTNMMSTVSIPELYRKQIIRALKQTDQWEWKYFLFGTTVLAPTFIPIVQKRTPGDSTGGGCGTSGSSCGSSDGDSGGSCGSSCGGCGGD